MRSERRKPKLVERAGNLVASLVIAAAFGAAGCTCGPAEPIALLPDGSVGVPVPTEVNVYTCRCICEVPIEHTTSCPNIDIEGRRAFETTGRVGGPNEGRGICQISTSLPFCFPPNLNPAHVSAPAGTLPATNGDIFADCQNRAGFLAEEVTRSIYSGCSRTEPDGTCPSRSCMIDCECGAILDSAGNVATSVDAKCNEDCPAVAWDRFAGSYGNYEDATFVPAPNDPGCPLAADTPVACRPPQLDPPGVPPDGMLSGWFGPMPGRVTDGESTIVINAEAPIPATIGGAVSLGRAPCTDCVTPLSLDLRIADLTLPGRADLSGLSMIGAVLPPGIPVDAYGHAVVPIDSFLGTVIGTASRTELGITHSERRAYFVPNPTPMYLDVDPVGRAFSLSADFFATVNSDTSARFELRLSGVFDRLPPVADAGPDRVVECTSPDGAALDLDASASHDPDGDIMAYRWVALDPWEYVGATALVHRVQPLGSRTYGLGVSDVLLALAEDELVVDVVDTTGPNLEATATPGCLWPPNHRLVRFAIGEALDVVTDDACGAVESVRIINVESDQPVDGIGDGASAPDIYFGPGGACLRAERDARGGGDRTYTITLEAVDASGNASTREIAIVAPHSRGGCANVDPELLVDDAAATEECAFPHELVPPAPVPASASAPAGGRAPARHASAVPAHAPSCQAGPSSARSSAFVLAVLAGLLWRVRRRLRPAALVTIAAVAFSGCTEGPDRNVSTLAGGMTSRYADGIGTEAGFRAPTSIVMASDGYLYVGDELRVRRVSTDGEVTTLAGGGSGGSGFEDGIGVDASFFGGVGVTTGGPDRLFVADGGNHAIRSIRISTAEVTTVVGGLDGYADGTFDAARFDHPRDLAYDAARDLLYVYDSGSSRIRIVDLGRREVLTLAGSGLRGYQDGVGTEASFWATSIALDGEGGLLVGDAFNHVVRHVSAGGLVTTLAGDATADTYVEGSSARLRAPAGLVSVGAGRFWLADAGALVIREIDLGGTTRWIAGRPLLAGNMLSDAVDGPAREAVFRAPTALAVGDGRVYVLEQYRIRVIEPGP